MMTGNVANSASRMVVCAWCQTIMKPGFVPATHGICPQCQEGLYEEFEQIKQERRNGGDD